MVIATADLPPVRRREMFGVFYASPTVKRNLFLKKLRTIRRNEQFDEIGGFFRLFFPTVSGFSFKNPSRPIQVEGGGFHCAAPRPQVQAELFEKNNTRFEHTKHPFLDRFDCLFNQMLFFFQARFF